MSRSQNEKVNALLDSWKEDYAGMLSRWLSVPSLKADPQDGAPFGPEVRRMLDMAMKDAADMGFDTRNFDGYARLSPHGSETGSMPAAPVMIKDRRSAPCLP